MPNIKQLTKDLNKAKIGILSVHSSAFICTILFSLKLRWEKSIPTAATNGEYILINPDFFHNLTSSQRIGLLAHEAWHVAFEHMVRGVGYDKEKYNKAADYVINNMLTNKNYKLPDGGLINHKYDKMATEQIYKELPDDPYGSKDNYDCDIIPISGDSLQEVKNKEATIKSIIVKASIQSKIFKDEAGTIPGDIQRVIDELCNPKLDWFTILMQHMTAYAKTDYSFKRPNKRFMPDFYLPSLYGESMNDLGLAFDTSSSVNDEEFNAYYSETKYMRECLNPVLTTIIDFDTKIHNVHILNQDESMGNIKFNGRGGTKLKPVFKYFKEYPPTVLIIFSDLECRKIIEDPGFPVIWIAVNNPNASVNFGKLIYYETK